LFYFLLLLIISCNVALRVVNICYIRWSQRGVGKIKITKVGDIFQGWGDKIY